MGSQKVQSRHLIKQNVKWTTYEIVEDIGADYSLIWTCPKIYGLLRIVLLLKMDVLLSSLISGTTSSIWCKALKNLTVCIKWEKSQTMDHSKLNSTWFKLHWLEVCYAYVVNHTFKIHILNRTRFHTYNFIQMIF